MEQLDIYLDKLGKSTQTWPGVKQLSEKTGLSAGHIVAAAIGLVVLLVFLGIGSDLIVELIGIFYPVFMSLKAIESKQAEDDKLWLTYWVVYGLYTVIDSLALVFYTWIPFYYPIKLIVLTWLFAPQTRGAVQVYDGFIRTYLLKHEREIDFGISQVSNLAGQASNLTKAEILKKFDGNTHKSF